MTSTTAPLTEAEVRAMSTAEVRVNLERCTRLVGHPSLLQRLPDHGNAIRHRHALFTEELARREAESANASTSTADVLSASPTKEQRRRDNEVVQLAEATAGTTTSRVDATREIGEKYRDYRVPVEATVRRMYEGAISEAELQRILQSVPPTYFLTYEETCAMERSLAKEARKAELQKLAAESARQSRAPA
ncbi:hypothetical protein ABB37_07429 [Leptomonas pyrrhocoris]|uniref:Uncharacterized protein n=1 Tax=Leptomonas pyrrhocoris TaxID=157538 RepID=A0A0N0DT88_LEPPY|nr:hypothetical protein ABB37_07429 [Leptomonas pyrrhocoris]KPA77114.1 hypothetical protein ABB37_07429 [Leptomonas pyrrhocoris]|eukprot:XP_015655553.1 hypothetical protein ABB37_07429 [Leptomonas pyrrhocoris]